MWARPSFCTKLWYKRMGGFWLGSHCDISGVFRVFKFIFVTYPSMLYPAKKIFLCYIGRYLLFILSKFEIELVTKEQVFSEILKLFGKILDKSSARITVI